jgi:hypothetical protein
MITSTKPNKNSPVLQHTLTILPSRSNALRISLEHATLRVPSAKIAEILRRMLCSSYSRAWGFVLYNWPFKLSHKYVTSHFFYWELVLLETGTKSFCDVSQQTHIWNTLHQTHKLLTGMSDSTHVVTGPNGLQRNALPVANAVHDASLFADN